jgi:hypothetical protein
MDESRGAERFERGLAGIFSDSRPAEDAADPFSSIDSAVQDISFSLL